MKSFFRILLALMFAWLFGSFLPLFAQSQAAERQEGVSLYFHGDSGKAEEYFKKHLESQPEDAEIWGYLGDIYYDKGKLGKAEESYRNALESRPSSVRWNLSLAGILNARGLYDESEIIYRGILDQSPGHLPAKRELVDSLFYQGKWTAALQANDELREQLGDSWIEEYVGANLSLGIGKILEAKEHLENVVRLQPELFRPRMELCGVYLRLGDYEKCGEIILDHEPAEIQDVEFCMLRASYHMKKRDFDEADRWIRRALEISPQHPQIVSLQYINDMHLGRIVLDEVRKLEGGVKGSLMEHYRRAALLMESGHILQAKEKIQWLMQYYPDDLDLKLMLALIEGELGDFETAIPMLEDITRETTGKITVVEMAQNALRDYVRQREFEERVKAEEWSDAEKMQTKYFDVKLNVAPPYREQILEALDEYVEGIIGIIRPLFGREPDLRRKRAIRIYAEKKVFVREAYDYFFSDAVLFSGVYVGEQDSIYYHFNKELKGSGIAHEIGHLVVHHLMINTPIWLDEGIADYTSMKLVGIDFLERKLEGKRYMGHLSRFGKLPELDVIVKTLDYEPRSYVLWRNAVEFMFEFEDGKYLPYLKDYADLVSNESFEIDPFREAFGPVWEQMNEDWEKFASLKIRP